MKQKKNNLDVKKVFVDRDDARKLFWDKYNECKDSIGKDGDINVIVYYGIGGIGKSSLIEELQKEMDLKLTKPKRIVYNFDKNSLDKVDILYRIRNLLHIGYNVEFKLFDYALVCYRLQTGEAIDSPNNKSILEENLFVSQVLSVIEEVPMIGTVAKVGKLFISGATIAVEEYKKRHNIDFTTIKNLPANDLYENLHKYFAQDLEEYMQDQNTPLTIFFDTYEKLISQNTIASETSSEDEWLREMISLLPGSILWVMLGRKDIQWEDFDKEWVDAITRYNLTSLDKDYVFDLLKGKDIDEKYYIDIYDVSKGIPIYLDICVEQYNNYKSNGREITKEIFGSNPTKLINNFYGDMEDDERSITETLACLRHWDENLLNYVIDIYIGNIKRRKLDKILTFSFISTNEGISTFHETISDILKNSAKNKEAIINTAIEYLEKIDKNNDNYKRYLKWKIEYKLEVLEENHIEDYYNEIKNNEIVELKKIADYDTIIFIIQKFLTKINDDLKKASLLNDLANIYINAGKYQQARKALSDAEKIIESNETADSVSQLIISNEFLKAKLYRILDEKDEVDEIIKKIRDYKNNDLISKEQSLELLECSCYLSKEKDRNIDIKELKKKINERINLEDDNSEAYFHLKNMLINIRLNDIRDRDNIQEIYNLAIDNYNNCRENLSLNNEVYLEAERLIHTCLFALEKYEESLEFETNVYNRLKDSLGENHPQTIQANIKIANSLSRIGEKDRAIQIYFDSYERRKNVLGPEHIMTIGTLSNILIIKEDEEDYLDTLIKVSNILVSNNKTINSKFASIIRDQQIEYLIANNDKDNKLLENIIVEEYRKEWKNIKDLISITDKIIENESVLQNEKSHIIDITKKVLNSPAIVLDNATDRTYLLFLRDIKERQDIQLFDELKDIYINKANNNISLIKLYYQLNDLDMLKETTSKIIDNFYIKYSDELNSNKLNSKLINTQELIEAIYVVTNYRIKYDDISKLFNDIYKLALLEYEIYNNPKYLISLLRNSHNEENKQILKIIAPYYDNPIVTKIINKYSENENKRNIGLGFLRMYLRELLFNDFKDVFINRMLLRNLNLNEDDIKEIHKHNSSIMSKKYPFEYAKSKYNELNSNLKNININRNINTINKYSWYSYLYGFNCDEYESLMRSTIEFIEKMNLDISKTFYEYDTFAALLDHNGKSEEAVSIQKKVIDYINSIENSIEDNTDYYVRYIIYNYKVGNIDIAKEYNEKIKNNKNDISNNIIEEYKRVDKELSDTTSDKTN